jgi:hypothetical protein
MSKIFARNTWSTALEDTSGIHTTFPVFWQHFDTYRCEYIRRTVLDVTPPSKFVTYDVPTMEGPARERPHSVALGRYGTAAVWVANPGPQPILADLWLVNYIERDDGQPTIKKLCWGW